MPDILPVAIPVSLFDHNWIDNSVLEGTWPTQIDQFVTTAEQRRGRSNKPARELTLSGITFSRGDAGVFLNSLRLGSGTRYYQPLSPDETILAADAASGSSVLSCDTTNRRFFVGFRVLIVVWANAKASTIALGVIQAVSATTITLAAPLGATVLRGASIYPAIETEVNLKQDASVATDRHLTFTATFNERPGAPALPALSTPGIAPVGEPTYRSLPILSIPHNEDRNTVGRQRVAEQTEVGLDTIIQIYGDTAYLTATLSFVQLSRTDAFRVLKFFDSRGGTTHPFWYPNRTADIGLITKVSNTIFRVEKTISVNDLLAVKFLAFWTDTTVAVRRIVSVTDNPDYLQVVVDEAVTFTQTEIVRVSWATMARFSTDSIRETWQNKQTMTTSLSVIGISDCSTALCVGEGCEGGAGCEGNLPEPEDPRTDDPDEPPWEPDDACEASSADVPMYYDCTEARSSDRAAIRAADLTMPEKVRLSIKRGLVRDTNHPHAAAMSDALDNILYRDHFLEFNGTIPRTISQNPYHIRVGGVDPVHTYSLPGGGVDVANSPFWYKTIAYMVGATPHTLFLRMYIEWALNPDGAWGALICVIGWSSEIMPTYVDGTPFVPFMSIPFSLTDPMVSGLLHSRPAEEKWFHPKLLFAAVVPTTWHSPVGYDWFPPNREARLAECYRSLSGAPWSTGTATDAIDNSVFGVTVGGHNKAAMTLGGWSVSEPFEWLCIENSAGTGHTYLKPTNPGWDEANAGLTLLNDLSIEICSPSQTPIDGCSGHPLDPLEGVGGTHACWRNSPVTPSPDLVPYLCVPIGKKSTEVPFGTVTVVEQCLTVVTTFGPSEGEPGMCEVITSDCYAAARPTMLDVPFYDAFFAVGGDPDSRQYFGKGFYPDPDYEFFGWVYDGSPTIYDDWVASIGAWTFSDNGGGLSRITNTSLGGNTNARGYAEYAPAGPSQTFDDGSIAATLIDSAVPKGLAVRSEKNGSNLLHKGYTAVVDRAADLVRIWRIDTSTTRTLLGSAPIAQTGNVRLIFRAFGSLLRAEWGGGVIEVHDCLYTVGGFSGLVLEGAASGAVFEDIRIFDENFRCLEVSFTVNGPQDDMSGLMDSKLGQAYIQGDCDSTTPPGCDGSFPGGCSCTSRHLFVFAHYAGSSLNYPLGNAAPADGSWYPPDDVGNCDDDPCPPSPGPTCEGQCPPTFLAFSVRLPGNCADPTNPTGSRFVDGFDVYHWSHVVCL